jgi:hypothetical protein
MASHVPDQGFVYVARAERSGLVKIGHSHNVSGRLRSLKASAREPIVLLAVLRGWRDTERALLARVKAHRVTVKGNSEWHVPHPEVEALIASLPTEARVNIHTGPHRHSNAAPKRPRAEVQAERERLADERSARFLARHGHPFGTRRTGCEMCARENALVRRVSVAPCRATTAAINAHCAQAPALTGGA